MRRALAKHRRLVAWQGELAKPVHQRMWEKMQAKYANWQRQQRARETKPVWTSVVEVAAVIGAVIGTVSAAIALIN